LDFLIHTEYSLFPLERLIRFCFGKK